MQVETYDEKTKESVETFLRGKRQAISSELVSLGGEKRVINWMSLQLIITELRREGKVRETRIGRKVKLYEWIGD